MMWTLVTGGAKGLGAEICLTLAEKGLPVLIHYNSSEAEALSIVQRCRNLGVASEAIQGNFSTLDSTKKFLEKLHPHKVKNLINNVGPYLIESAMRTSDEEWIQLFQTNLHAPFVLSRALIPSIQQSQGSIINIGVAGLNSLRADVYSTAYSTAKHSLWMLTKSLAKELASSFVRVNMVSPGYLENSIDLPHDISQLPMKRLASLKEVANVISFLLSDGCQYITGQNIEVAGAVRL